MARTAPIPNIPAIPGMNPGVWVMGGGAGGGGGDGNGAGADGQNQGACGSGGGANGCGHASHAHAAGSPARGDPVDVATGAVFTLPAREVAFGGTMRLSLARRYRSNCEEDIGWGRGWLHDFAWELERGRRLLHIRTGTGARVGVSRVAPGQGTMGGGGILVVGLPGGYSVSLGGLRYLFWSRDARSGRIPLAAVVDETGNRAELHYDGGGALTRILDADGRRITIEYRAGRIHAIIAEGEHVAGYAYDDSGRLVLATSATGHETRYAYGKNGLLELVITPEGRRTHYRYDAEGRAVETWIDAVGGGEPSLASWLPETLADGQTPARGAHHVRFEYGPDCIQVIDSRRVDRYDLNAGGRPDKVVNGASVHSYELDESGHTLSYTDPLEATTTYERNNLGDVLCVTAPDGAMSILERDGAGALVRMVDPAGGTTTVTRGRDSFTWTDPIGARFGVTVDPRGRIATLTDPYERTTEQRYDEHGNQVSTRWRTGKTTERTFDRFGRLLSVEDPGHLRAESTLDLAGNVIAHRGPGGIQKSATYDSEGNITSVLEADGSGVRYRWGGFQCLTAVERPDGSTVKFAYDREGSLVEVTSPAGRSHVIDRDPRGLPRGERTVDGRERTFAYDKAGNLVREELKGGVVVEYERDIMGRLKALRVDDDIEETYEYDVHGRLVRADAPGASVVLVRNALGWVVAEEQTVGGETHRVSLEYDLHGKVVRRTTDLGHDLRYHRDVYGHALMIEIDGQALGVTRDASGRARLLDLPSGGCIRSDYHPSGMLEQVAVVVEPTLAPGPNEPAWVGSRETKTMQIQFDYDALGRLTREVDSLQGERKIGYDACGRLSGCAIGDQVGEYGYDAAENLYSKAEGRRYDERWRLVEQGDRRLFWDDFNRLQGWQNTVTGERAELTWDPRGWLAAIVSGDMRICYDYDAFARRVQKRSYRARGPGQWELVERVRFVWDQQELVHEVRERPGDAQRDVRTFWIQPGTSKLRGVRRADVAGGEWVFAVLGGDGVPRHFVDGSGRVVESVARDAWGLRRGGEMRGIMAFPGQYEDPESGLHYNRHRYYDPSAGRYISPDPVGIAGGLNPFAYAANMPVSRADPDGLMPFTRIRIPGQPDIVGGSARTPTGRANRGTTGHDPVVQEIMGTTGEFVDTGGAVQRDDTGRSPGGPCSEPDALSQVARRIRREDPSLAANNPANNAEVRRRMEAQLNGATIDTFTDDPRHVNDASNTRMAPCSVCARMFDATPGAGPGGARINGPDGQPWNRTHTQQSQNESPQRRPDDPEATRRRREGEPPEAPPPAPPPPPPRPLSANQAGRVAATRRRHPETTAGMSDRDVWESLGAIRSDDP
jgi:RHS repeat-associated protein